MKKILLITFIIVACTAIGACFNGCARNTQRSSEDMEMEVSENNATIEISTTKSSEANESETEGRKHPVPPSSASAGNGFRFISVAVEKDYEYVFDYPDAGIITLTGKNAAHGCLNVIYVSEMLLVSPDFATATRTQYAELIKNAYGVSEYDTLTVNDIQWQRYRISEEHSAYVSILDDCAVYVELVGTGGYEAAGLTCIKRN